MNSTKIYNANELTSDFLKETLPRTSIYCKLVNGQIVELYGNPYRNKNRALCVHVRFIDTDGHTIATLTDIQRAGGVRDPNKLRADGGYMGATSKELRKMRAKNPKLFRKVYMMYDNMMKRCYKPSSRGYPSYGLKGVTVSDELHSFYNFYHYITKHPDFGEEKLLAGELVMDKDMTQLHIPIGQRVYSKDTIRLISRELNYSMVEHNPLSEIKIVKWSMENLSKFMIVTFPDGHEELVFGASRFCRYMMSKYGIRLHFTNVSACLRGISHTSKGFKFRFPTEEEMQLINAHSSFIKNNVYDLEFQIKNNMIYANGRVLMSRIK